MNSAAAKIMLIISYIREASVQERSNILKAIPKGLLERKRRGNPFQLPRASKLQSQLRSLPRWDKPFFGGVKKWIVVMLSIHHWGHTEWRRFQATIKMEGAVSGGCHRASPRGGLWRYWSWRRRSGTCCRHGTGSAWPGARLLESCLHIGVWCWIVVVGQFGLGPTTLVVSSKEMGSVVGEYCDSRKWMVFDVF